MNQPIVSVEKGTFRSRLIPLTATLFAAAALCGASAMATLLHPSSIPAIIADLELGKIYDPSAQMTWLVIYIAVTLVNFVGTLLLSAGLWQIILGRRYEGTELLYKLGEWMLRAVNISAALVLPYFIIRAVRYIILCCGSIEGMVPLYAMVLMEGVLGAQDFVLFTRLRRFLDCCMDAAASIGYTLCSGKLKAPAIPGFAATGFLILGLFDAAIALDRFFTMTYLPKNLSQGYIFPLTADPVQLFSGASFACAAIGSVLLFFYLRGYKYRCESLLLRASKTIKN